MKGEEEKRKLAVARVCARGEGIACDWFLLEFIYAAPPANERKKAANLDSIPPCFFDFLRGFSRMNWGSLRGAETAVPSVRAKCKTKARSVRNRFAQRKRAANELFSLTLLLSVIDNFC